MDETRVGTGAGSDAGAKRVMDEGGASDPPACRRAPSDLRTLAVLRALERYTDERNHLSAPDIARLLAEGRPDLPQPLTASPSSVRNSVATLRSAGIDIRSMKNRGYALVSRSVSSADLQEIVRALLGGSLGNARRLHLVEALLPFAGPGQRAELESLLRRGRGRGLQRRRATMEFVTVPAQELLRRCMLAGAHVTFELASGTRRMRPIAVFTAGDVPFVEGEVEGSGVERSGLRTVRVDRLSNLACRHPSGTVLIAADTLRGPRLTVGEEAPEGAGA